MADARAGRMTIVPRESEGRGTRYGVRIHRDGKRVWMGTFDTLEEAEAIEREARVPKPRTCLDCGTKFKPQKDRRVRCWECVNKKRKTKAKNDDHWLYLCHNADQELLYVGITSSGIKRFRGHGDVQDWWKTVDNIVLRHFETRDEAVAAERLAIRDLSPKYNVQGKPRKLKRPWPENVVPLPNASRKRPAS